MACDHSDHLIIWTKITFLNNLLYGLKKKVGYTALEQHQGE